MAGRILAPRAGMELRAQEVSTPIPNHWIARESQKASLCHLVFSPWVHAKALQLCLTLCDPMDCKPTRLLRPWDSPGKNTGLGLPCPPPGDLPDPRIEPMSLPSPALPGRFFYHGRHLGSLAFSLTRLQIDHLLGQDHAASRRRQWHPTPVLLPGESHGRRSLVGRSPWVH